MAISSADEFIRLRYSDDTESYDRAARDSASVQVWRDVIEAYPEARVWVAQNKTVPLEILEILASDPDPRVRFMVAMKRKLTPKLLARMAFDEDDSVRMAVARHNKTSSETLEALKLDPWDQVREVAIKRINQISH